MRHILILAASVLPLVTVAVDDASAQRRFGGGGFHAGGFHGGMRAGGWHGGAVGFRGGYGYRGVGWRGGWNRPYVRAGNYWGWRRGWGYPRYGYGWGTAGLIAGTAIAASAAYPYYGYEYSYPDAYPYGYAYSYPTYSYPTYSTPVSGDVGGYCATPVRTCALIDAGLIGTGCSCRVSGGRARGTVIGP